MAAQRAYPRSSGQGRRRRPRIHRSCGRTGDNYVDDGAFGLAAARARASEEGSVVVEPLLDELLLHGPAAGVEAGELEMLLELEVDVVLPAAVLLDRYDCPVAEPLRLVGVELDVHLGDDVVLLVEDQDDVGLVVD